MRSLVFESWRSSPLIHVRSARLPGSATSSAVVIHGPNGHGAVEALRARPLALGALQVARGEVVGHRVAGDLAARAHDDGQLALVVEALDDRGRRAPARPGAATEVGSFMKTIGRSGSSAFCSCAWAR